MSIPLPDAPLTQPPLKTRSLALGDSYTIGESVELSERWPYRLASLLRRGAFPVEFIAKTGWTAEELAVAIERVKPKGPFDLVTLLIGVNDQYRGLPIEAYRTHFRRLLTTAVGLAGGRSERVIVLSIPDWGATPFAAGRDRERIAQEIDAFNDVNRDETAQAKARYVDVTPVSRRAAADGGLVAADGLHPSGKMYQSWAELALPEALGALSE